MAKEKSVTAKAGTLVYGHIDPLDVDGQEVPVADGSEIWSSSDETIATVKANPKNPKYFIALLTGLVGDVQVRVKLNADPNSNDPEDDITDSVTIHCLPDLATNANLGFDDSDVAPDVTGNAGAGSAASSSSSSTTGAAGSTASSGDGSSSSTSGSQSSPGASSSASSGSGALTPTSYSDHSGNTIVVQQAGAAPAVGEAATVNGQNVTSTTTYSLLNGATLVLDASSMVQSYTPAA